MNEVRRLWYDVRIYTLTSRQLRKVSALNVIIGLEEDLPKSRLSDRVVLEVELIKSMEGVRVGVHIQGVYR